MRWVYLLLVFWLVVPATSQMSMVYVIPDQPSVRVGSWGALTLQELQGRRDVTSVFWLAASFGLTAQPWYVRGEIEMSLRPDALFWFSLRDGTYFPGWRGVVVPPTPGVGKAYLFVPSIPSLVGMRIWVQGLLVSPVLYMQSTNPASVLVSP